MTFELCIRRTLLAVIILSISACTTVASAPSGSLPDIREETAILPLTGFAGSERQTAGEASIFVYQEPTSKTERAIGVVALGALIVGLGIVAVGLYKLFQALSG